jgi:hypothetical protein
VWDGLESSRGRTIVNLELLEHGPDVGRRCEEQSSNGVPGRRRGPGGPSYFFSSILIAALDR